MGWFTRKKKVVAVQTPGDEEETKGKKISEFEQYQKYRLKDDEFWAFVKDVNGDTSIVRRIIRCKRFQHDDSVVTLRPVNKKENFEELQPQLDEDYLNLKKADIETKLVKANKQLQDVNDGKVKNLNIWNIKYDIFQLKAMLRKTKFGKANFMTFNEHREPIYTFLRKGSTLHPMAEDVDTSTVYVPSDYKKKKSAMSVRNKEAKYSKFAGALVNIGTAILLIVNLIMFAGNGFWSYAMYKYSDSESAMAKINTRFDNAASACLNSIAIQNVELTKTSSEVTGISKVLKDQLQPTTIIEGQTPIDFTK